jgi:hypothetical protein
MLNEIQKFLQSEESRSVVARLSILSSRTLTQLVARVISSILRDKEEFLTSLNDIIKGQDDVNQCAALICREGEF